MAQLRDVIAEQSLLKSVVNQLLHASLLAELLELYAFPCGMTFVSEMQRPCQQPIGMGLKCEG